MTSPQPETKKEGSSCSEEEDENGAPPIFDIPPLPPRPTTPPKPLIPPLSDPSLKAPSYGLLDFYDNEDDGDEEGDEDELEDDFGSEWNLEGDEALDSRWKSSKHGPAGDTKNYRMDKNSCPPCQPPKPNQDGGLGCDLETLLEKSQFLNMIFDSPMDRNEMEAFVPVNGLVAPEQKRKEFISYLKSTGFTHAIAKILVALHDEPERPTNDSMTEYITTKILGLEMRLADTRTELINYNSMLRDRIQKLSLENDWIRKQLDNYTSSETPVEVVDPGTFPPIEPLIMKRRGSRQDPFEDQGLEQGLVKAKVKNPLEEVAPGILPPSVSTILLEQDKSIKVLKGPKTPKKSRSRTKSKKDKKSKGKSKDSKKSRSKSKGSTGSKKSRSKSKGSKGSKKTKSKSRSKKKKNR